MKTGIEETDVGQACVQYKMPMANTAEATE